MSLPVPTGSRVRPGGRRPSHALVTGPSGSGKSTLARYFRDRGKVAWDGDDFPGLARFVDRHGNECRPTRSQWRRYDGLRWVWDPERLAKLLDGPAEVYLFGSSDNLFELVGLFQRKFFLRGEPSLIGHRLNDPAQDNDVGRQEPQRGPVLDRLRPVQSRAVRAGFLLVDASWPPRRLFDFVCGSGSRLLLSDWKA